MSDIFDFAPDLSAWEEPARPAVNTASRFEVEALRPAEFRTGGKLPDRVQVSAKPDTRTVMRAEKRQLARRDERAALLSATPLRRPSGGLLPATAPAARIVPSRPIQKKTAKLGAIAPVARPDQSKNASKGHLHANSSPTRKDPTRADCKERPDNTRGGASGRSFVPWCGANHKR